MIAGLALGASGCAIIGFGQEGHEGGTATLSGAALAASDSTRKVKPLDVGDSTPPPDVEVSAGGDAGDGGESLAPAGGLSIGRPYERTHPIWGIVAEAGTFANAAYQGFGGGGLSIGGYPGEHVRVDLIGTAGSVDFTRESLLGHAFKNGVDLKLEVLARYELGDPKVSVSFAPLVGIGTGTLFWDYATPLPVTEDGVLRSVSDDQINHFYGYAGLGMSLVRTRHFLLDGRLMGGGRLYGWHTKNGLSNDLLPAVGFAQFQIGAGFR